MLTYLIRRLLVMIPIVLGVATIVFFAMRLAPGDPVRIIAGPQAPEDRVQEIREKYGFDKPLIVQYTIWLSQLVRGEFGNSVASGVPAIRMVTERLGATLELTISAFLVSLVLSVLLGTLAAVNQNGFIDNLVTFNAMLWLSMPGFWLGLMLMSVLAVAVPIFPISGRGDAFWTWEGIRHLILPAVTLALPSAGATARIVRSSLLETMSQDYVRTARSKGLKERLVVSKHVFRNSLIPLITLMALRLPALFGGAVIVESVFAWPGLGTLLIKAVFNRDYAITQTTALFIAALVILANLLADFMYSVADPRIRLD